MTLPRLGLVFATLGLSGCLFASGGGADPDAADVGGGGDDVSTPDTSAPPDMASPPDAAAPPDASTDASSPPDDGVPDAGPIDMGNPEPWVVVRHFEVALGGQPSSVTPLEVARFADGFLVAYRDDDQDTAWVAWYTSDQDAPKATHSFPADHGSVDVAGTALLGVVSAHSTMAVHNVVVAPVGTPWTLREADEPSEFQTYFDTAVAFDDNAIYTVTGRAYGGEFTGLSWIEPGDASSGTNELSTADLRLTNIEAVGGGRLARPQVFAAGIVSGNYGMFDFDYSPNQEWTRQALGCGPAAIGAPGGGRIVPLRDGWAAALRPSMIGPKAVVVRCLSSGQPIDIDVSLFANVAILDIAVASEDLGNGGGFGVAWVGPAGAGFGLASFDRMAQTFGINAPWHLDGTAEANRVRVASNPTRSQWAVAVTQPDGGDLYIVERNPSLP